MVKKIFIGRYKSEFEAAEAYDKKAVELFGEFANLSSQILTFLPNKAN